MGNYLQSLRVPPLNRAEELEERQHPLYYDWSLPKWTPFKSVAAERDEATQDSNLTSIANSHAIANLKALKSNPIESASSTLLVKPLDSDRNVAECNASVGRHADVNKRRNSSTLKAQTTALNDRHNKTHQPLKAANVASEQDRGNNESPSLYSLTKEASLKSTKSNKEALRNSLKATLTNTLKTTTSEPRNDQNAKQYYHDQSIVAKTTTSNKTTANNNRSHQSKVGSSSAKNNTKGIDIMRPHTIEPARVGGIDNQASIKAATNIHAVNAKAKSCSNVETKPSR